MSDERKDENLPARPASSLMTQLIRQRSGAGEVHFSNISRCIMRCAQSPRGWLLLILIFLALYGLAYLLDLFVPMPKEAYCAY